MNIIIRKDCMQTELHNCFSDTTTEKANCYSGYKPLKTFYDSTPTLRIMTTN